MACGPRPDGNPTEALTCRPHCAARSEWRNFSYTLLCLANYSVDRPEKTLELADKTIRLSPRDPKLPLLYWQKGLAHFLMQRDEQGIDLVRRTLCCLADLANWKRRVGRDARAEWKGGGGTRYPQTLSFPQRFQDEERLGGERAIIIASLQSVITRFRPASIRGGAPCGDA